MSVYSITTESINYYGKQWFFEFLLNAIIFIGLAIVITFFYVAIDFLLQVYKYRKEYYSTVKCKFGKKVKFFLRDTCYSLLMFALVSFMAQLINIIILILIISVKDIFSSSAIEWGLLLFVLSITEIITTIMIISIVHLRRRAKLKASPKAKVKSDTETEEATIKSPSLHQNHFLESVASFMIILIFVYSGGAYFLGVWTARQTRSFFIVEDKYAIVYRDNEHFWTVSARENDGALTLNTTIQKAMGIDGVEATLQKFKEVIFVYN